MPDQDCLFLRLGDYFASRRAVLPDLPGPMGSGDEHPAGPEAQRPRHSPQPGPGASPGAVERQP